MKTPTQNQNSKLGSRPEQLSTSNAHRINFQRREANRNLDTSRLLDLLHREAPRFHDLAEIVGQWVWVQFDGKQPRRVTSLLSELGFHWNRRRQLWQHPCGVFTAQRSTDDPRRRYGSRNAQRN